MNDKIHNFFFATYEGDNIKSDGSRLCTTRGEVEICLYLSKNLKGIYNLETIFVEGKMNSGCISMGWECGIRFEWL